LEIRVVKEQLQAMDGCLKWVSSERQFADGLTKESARQLLADRLRYGQIKFVWDPNYTAAKKKTKQSRDINEGEHAMARPNRHMPVIEEANMESYEVTTEDSSGNAYVACCDMPVYYKDMVPQKTNVRIDELKLPEVTYDPSEMSETEDDEATVEFAVNGGLRMRHDALWAVLGFFFNLVRRFIFVLLYGVFPKVKAEMNLVARIEDQCEAVEELPLVEIGETLPTGTLWPCWSLLSVLAQHLDFCWADVAVMDSMRRSRSTTAL